MSGTRTGATGIERTGRKAEWFYIQSDVWERAALGKSEKS